MKISAYVPPMPGHLFPFIPILQALQEHQHDIALNICTLGAIPFDSGGIPYRVLRWAQTAQPDQPLPAFDSDLHSNFERFRWFGESLSKAIDCDLTVEDPDFVLVDPMLWGAMISAEASGIPWATVAHNPLMFRAQGLDVRGPGLAPPRNLRDRLRIRLMNFAIGISDMEALHLVNNVRASYRLKPIRAISERYGRASITFATTVEPFEYPRTDWPPNLRFVGPLLWDPPSAVPEWIARLDDRPLILVVGSSIPEAGKARTWTSIALMALASEAVQIVATLPSDKLLHHIPEGVILTDFIPHSLLLRKAACVVCHGGPGITMKALAAGIPVVVIPFVYDRLEIGRRVEVANAGVMLPGNMLSVDRLRAATKRAIGCRRGAERIAELFRRSGGARAVVAEIERFAGGGRRV